MVAATARNAMLGLPTVLHNLKRLRATVRSLWFVVVESDTHDATRTFMCDLALKDPNVRLLGCNRVNSAEPCLLDIRYSSGKVHVPGSILKRTHLEKVERGLVMSALRNMYLNYIYDHPCLLTAGHRT